jgi:hypothetical protein
LDETLTNSIDNAAGDAGLTAGAGVPQGSLFRKM